MKNLRAESQNPPFLRATRLASAKFKSPIGQGQTQAGSLQNPMRLSMRRRWEGSLLIRHLYSMWKKPVFSDSLERFWEWHPFPCIYYFIYYGVIHSRFKMLCLCLYVPVPSQHQTAFEYFESNGLPSELKSLFKLSLFLPSEEFSTYRKWRQVWFHHCYMYYSITRVMR